MRMKCLRIFPETIPRISCWLLSSLSLNIALGSAVVTMASTSIGSDLGIQRFSKPSIVLHNGLANKLITSLLIAQAGFNPLITLHPPGRGGAIDHIRKITGEVVAGDAPQPKKLHA